jgi:hypothetical protein
MKQLRSLEVPEMTQILLRLIELARNPSMMGSDAVSRL